MLPAAVESVRCIEGCGGGGEPAAYIGLVVAFLSLAVAFAAWRVSQNSLKIAREEHRVFLRQLNARADFELTIEGKDHGPEIVTYAEEVKVVWKLGITNSGQRAAADVGINFLAPQLGVEGLVWTEETARFVSSQRAAERLTTTDELPASDGTSWPAQYLVQTLDRLSRRTHHISFAMATLVSPPPGESRIVPVKFKVWSDELPDDVEARWVTNELIIKRLG